MSKRVRGKNAVQYTACSTSKRRDLRATRPSLTHRLRIQCTRNIKFVPHAQIPVMDMEATNAASEACSPSHECDCCVLIRALASRYVVDRFHGSESEYHTRYDRHPQDFRDVRNRSMIRRLGMQLDTSIAMVIQVWSLVGRSCRCLPACQPRMFRATGTLWNDAPRFTSLNSHTLRLDHWESYVACTLNAPDRHTSALDLTGASRLREHTGMVPL